MKATPHWDDGEKSPFDAVDEHGPWLADDTLSAGESAARQVWKSSATAS